jgi:hypothetical protein
MSGRHWLTTHAQKQGHREGGGVADAVLPETVFTPAIAVIGAGEDRGTREASQQRRQLRIHPFEAGALATGTLGG